MVFPSSLQSLTDEIGENFLKFTVSLKACQAGRVRQKRSCDCRGRCNHLVRGPSHRLRLLRWFWKRDLEKWPVQVTKTGAQGVGLLARLSRGPLGTTRIPLSEIGSRWSWMKSDYRVTLTLLEPG